MAFFFAGCVSSVVGEAAARFWIDSGWDGARMAFDKGRRPGIPLAIGVGATGPIGIVSGKGTSEFVVGGMGRLEFGFLQNTKRRRSDLEPRFASRSGPF